MKTCRLCRSDQMTMFLDLGFTPPADCFLTKEQLDDPEIYYPLRVMRCDKCSFIQLSYVVSPEILYKNDYPYESSMTQTGRLHFNTFARSTFETFDLQENDLVIDIGSNVGVLLLGFKALGCRILGIEPAENIAAIAEKNGVPSISHFFSQKLAKTIVASHGKAKIITASNVFAHIDNLDDILKSIDLLLDAKGVFIIEAPYLVHTLDKLEYDTIYHEHLSYLSLMPLPSFLDRYGFEIFDARQVDIHGGSIRVFIARKGARKITSEVNYLLSYEAAKEIHSLEYLGHFAQRVEKNRYNLVALLRSLKQQGARIAGLSAPAKGMTLLNYCKIDSSILEFVTEKSTLKINKYTPGIHLKVLPDSALLTEKIDYALILAWNFKEEIMKNLTDFKKQGGKFIIPIPDPVII